ncbi:hypothetical protein YC2023_092179 [Brassica napus]
MPEAEFVPLCLGFNDANNVSENIFTCNKDDDKAELVSNLVDGQNMWLESLLDEIQDPAALCPESTATKKKAQPPRLTLSNFGAWVPHLRGSFPWARLGSGPLHPGGLYLGWGQGPTPSTAFDDRMGSSPPLGVEPVSMTIGPQGPYQVSYHIPSN